MDINDVSHRLYETFRQARSAKGIPQEALAQELHVSQPRVAEMEARLRDGRLTKQTALIFQTAAALGLVPMFIPAEAADRVAAVVQDAQAEAVRSTWDEVFIDLGAEDESSLAPAP